MSSILGKVITEIFIEFNQSIGKELVFFLGHLFSECTDFGEIKENFKVFCKENSLIENDKDIELTFNKIVEKLKDDKDNNKNHKNDENDKLNENIDLSNQK